MNIPFFPNATPAQRRTIVMVIAISVGIHLVAGLVAGVWIVARYLTTPPATFVAKKSVMLPPKLVDPRMQSSEFEGAAPKPAFDDKMASIRETNFALPDLPNMPLDVVPDPSAIVTETTLMGTGGQGSGGGSGNGSGGGGGGDMSAINFFGISAQAKSVVVIFDVSKSVQNKAEKSGVPITKIKEETLKMIEGLSINTTFNLFQFSRIYQPFSEQMMAPNQTNRDGAKAWLEKEFRTDGSLPRSVRGAKTPGSGQDNGITFVLEAALALHPNTIFLISDASFQSEKYSDQVPWAEVEAVVKKYDNAAEPTRIYIIGFEMKPEDKKAIADIVRKTRGKVREIGRD